jgi:hypothetical protein
LPVTSGRQPVVRDPPESIPHVAALVVREKVVRQQHVTTLGQDRLTATEVGRPLEQAGMPSLGAGPE